MRKRIGFTVGAALCFIAVVSTVLAAKPAKSTGHEQDELGYLVGKWTLNGKLESHPIYKNATVSGTMSCEWFDGHYAVLCQVDQQSSAPGIPTKALRIFGYSPEAHAYTSYGLTNTSQVATEIGMGNLENGTWTYGAGQKMTGKTVRYREKVTKVSATSFNLTQETTDKSGAWRKMAEATFTKAD